MCGSSKKFLFEYWSWSCFLPVALHEVQAKLNALHFGLRLRFLNEIKVSVDFRIATSSWRQMRHRSIQSNLLFFLCPVLGKLWFGQISSHKIAEGEGGLQARQPTPSNTTYAYSPQGIPRICMRNRESINTVYMLDNSRNAHYFMHVNAHGNAR